jgi:FAD:protein FMN transferase
LIPFRRPPALSAAAGIAVSAAILAACSPPAAQTRSRDIFSSRVVLTLRDHASEAVFEACFDRLREIDAELNMWDPASELSRLNAAVGGGPVAVSEDVAAVTARGLDLARLTDGIFDPTVGPLVRLWGIGTPAARVPSDPEIARARALVGWRRVRLDPAARTVGMDRGMALDFGALAKGYGAMEGARMLASRGVGSAVLDVGGCVVVMGSGPGHAAWRVGVQDPSSRRGTPLGYFTARDSAVDTSGCYERFLELGGRRYPHIMDTRTGRPVEGPIISATIIVPRDVNSDGPPLAMLVLGPEAGIALADRLGIPAVLIGTDKRLFVSRAAKPLFTLTDRSFTITY